MTRTLSYTEISTALQCWAAWDFSYGGRLAGTALKPRETAPRLSNGRAWGAGFAAWHATGERGAALTAIYASLVDDVTKMREAGIEPDFDAMLDQYDYLAEVFAHYADTAERLPNLSRAEDELNIPIPSRAGRRGSNKYRFHCYIDGHSTSSHPWIVEAKLRDSLTDIEIVEKQPQYRWYALAYALTAGDLTRPVGVLLDERLNAAPKPVNINKNGKPSHDKRQMVTPEAYLAACREHDVKPSGEALDVFRARRWHQRIPLVFTPAELKYAAQELVGAAQLIRDLDSGALHPIRNGKPANCRGCKFRAVCMNPENDLLINSLFTRTEPKRLRGPRPEGVR